jgi:hypothetical protein
MARTQKKKKLPKKVSNFIGKKFYDFKDETGKTFEFKKSKNPFSDIFEDFFKDYKPPKTQPLKDIFEDFFTDENKALDTIKKWKPVSNSAQTIKKITENTQPLSDKAHTDKVNKLTDMGGGRRRKQRFIKSKLVPLVPRFKPREKIGKDGFKHMLVGDNPVYKYMYEHELLTHFDIIKSHGKLNKKLTFDNNSWKEMGLLLKSLNMTPQEVFDYAINSVQTKKRFLELRLYREYESNSKLAINSFIEIYKKHLKTKQPLKVFAVSKPFINWCKEEDLYFKSDENLRQNIKLMIVSYNKDNPKDKIPLKIK